MGEFSITHLLILGGILLLFFGPSRLPGLGQSIGKAIRGFKDGLSDVDRDMKGDASRPGHDAETSARLAAAASAHQLASGLNSSKAHVTTASKRETETVVTHSVAGSTAGSKGDSSGDGRA